MTAEKKKKNKVWVACHECDLIHARAVLPDRRKAVCIRCGSVLYRQIEGSLDKSLALNMAALILLVLSNSFVFLSLEFNGRMVENHFISGALMLYSQGMGLIGLLVMLTSVVFPLITTCGMIYMLLPLKFNRRPPRMTTVYRAIRALTPWSLTSVFMLGILVSFVKLTELANVIPGISLASFVGLMLAMAAAQASFDPEILWPDTGPWPLPDHLVRDLRTSGVTAKQLGLVSCHTCTHVMPQQGNGTCPRCGSLVHDRKSNSIAHTWALLISAALLFIPANVYPAMTVIQLGEGTIESTILGGVVHLIEDGAFGLAMIIFFASIVVPVLKLLVLSMLLCSVHFGTAWRTKDRTVMFRVTEMVGAWSMVDVYVVAVLAGLVDMGALATIHPGVGMVFFAAVVTLTMFAAHRFDPRMIWDHAERKQ